ITSNYAVSVGAQGVLINRSTVTTSADGLSVSTATDINGDGINDKTVNDVTVKNADGTSTRTISSQARDGSLYNQVQQIITANGLQVTTKTDIDGVNGFDQTKTDLREVFADLSTRHTVTLANANGTTHSQTIENATVDRRSVSRTVDNNGDGFVDQTQTVVKATNGITTSTTTDKAKNGTTIDQTILITSANGLSITTKHDFDGNATIGKFKTDVTTYGLDGSTTETIENHNNDATLSLIDRTTLQISGNGLSQTAKSDYNGDGTFDLTVSDVKVLNANGSITETVANKNSLGTTTSQQTVTTSASGLSIITTQDINGDNTTDLTSNDITFLNANGSNSHLVSVLNSNGTLRSKSITITDVDAHLTVTNTDVNGDGKYDQTETITKWGSGNINDLTINRDIYGVTQSGTLVNSTANGLSKVTYHDYSGLGKFYDHVDNVTVINADGSRTNTISDYEINYSTFGDYLTHKEVVNTSASGLSITTNTYTLGLATPDRVRTDVTAIAADGSQIETAIDSFLVGGTHTIDKTTIAISADQLTKTITKNFPDANQVETVAIGVDGRTVDDTVTRTLSGVLISEFTTVTSANGLQSTHYDFRSGGTAYDLATTKSTVLNVDGSRTTTVQDLVGNNIIRDQSTTQISANGLIKLIKEDRNGDGVFERLTSDTTVLNTDGSRTQTISVTSNTNAPLDKLVSLKSANGLSTSEQTDFDGNGTYEHSVVYSRAADSSTTETTTLKKLSGATYEIDLQTLSANGLVSTLKQDLDGNGTYDRVRTVTTDLSGNSIIELKDQNSVGATIEKITIQVAENGLSNSASIDFNGDGIADITKIYNKNFSSFGGQTYEYTASSIGNGQFYNTQLTTIDPGGYHWSRVVNFFRDTISNSPGDPSDETVDSQRVIQTDGWDVTTITTKDSSTNALINKTTTQIQTTGFETLILIDNNGD
uniref:beta strand repeat-containing protein n=1 Tax=Janthinobacterium sp. TaxID=1871054 RepID=UPI00293D3E77